MNKTIYLDKENVSQQDIEFVAGSIKEYDCLSTKSKAVDDFEKKINRYIGAFGGVATNSCTSALHLALLAAEILPKDEVILPVLTFVATANVVKYVGANPVFVDVDIDTWNIDIKKIYQNINEKTKAIMPVDLYGNPTNIFFKLDNILIIQDCAQSIGATLLDLHTGLYADYAAFSFNGNKIMTTGAGGILIGDVLGHARMLSSQGRNDSGEIKGIGFNYKMAGLNAMLGIAQLRHLPDFLKKKKQFNNIYRNELDKFIKFQEATPESEPAWWITAGTIRENINLNEFQKYLIDRGIETRRVFQPITDLLPYREHKASFPIAEYIYEHGLCLPSSTLNEEFDIMYVCEMIKEFFNAF